MGRTITIAAPVWKELDLEDGASAAHHGEPVSACPHRPGTPEHSTWVRRWTDVMALRAVLSGDADRSRQAAGERFAQDFADQHDPVAEILGVDETQTATGGWAPQSAGWHTLRGSNHGFLHGAVASGSGTFGHVFVAHLNAREAAANAAGVAWMRIGTIAADITRAYQRFATAIATPPTEIEKLVQALRDLPAHDGPTRPPATELTKAIYERPDQWATRRRLVPTAVLPAPGPPAVTAPDLCPTHGPTHGGTCRPCNRRT